MFDLISYKKSYYSQNGEDGVLEEIFKRLKIDKGWFVDVGAWDSRYLSNTYLFVEKGWQGLEIEGNTKYVDKMWKILGNRFPSQIKVWDKYIGPSELEGILAFYKIPSDFDLLSIDIDTFDYWVWKSLTNFHPKVVIIETNSREGIVIQPLDSKKRIGSSPEAIRNLAREKNYKEAAKVEGNLIFVRSDLYDNL